ncbi:MAG: DUF3459 domain-containing protein, partial [Anaerolineales bacterium]|nr:DUF3459 domain-containing protein [Anaerolineales bacterium]
VPIPPDRVQDPPAVNQPEIAHLVGRDPERTPMQWDDGENAGFCAPGVTPWLPVHENNTAVNVTSQQAHQDSMLNLTRSLLQLRRDHPALHTGDFQSIEAPEGTFAYLRRHNDQQFLIILNFTDRSIEWALPYPIDQIVLSTIGDPTKINGDILHLHPNEGVLLAL